MMQKIYYMILCTLLVIAVWLYNRNSYLTLQRQQLNDALKLSQAELLYLQQEGARINQLTRENHLYIQQLKQESLRTQQILKEELKDEVCADKFVPDDVVNRLQVHARRIGQSVNP